MSQCGVVLLGKGMPFPAQYALPWLISWPLIVTLFTAWPTSLAIYVNEKYFHAVAGNGFIALGAWTLLRA